MPLCCSKDTPSQYFEGFKLSGSILLTQTYKVLTLVKMATIICCTADLGGRGWGEEEMKMWKCWRWHLTTHTGTTWTLKQNFTNSFHGCQGKVMGAWQLWSLVDLQTHIYTRNNHLVSFHPNWYSYWRHQDKFVG